MGSDYGMGMGLLMKILIACEFSGTVREAFTKLGHDVTSCDLEPTSLPGKHYQGSVLDILNDGWDMMVAHPPCTYLTVTGNKWFKDEYPELEFVEPSTEVFDLYAMYTIGWYYDDDRKVVDTKIPIEFKQHPLGETSTSILGLPYTEIKPRIVLPKKSKQIEGKYVVIAPHASAHAKYWNHKGGWQAVIDYLNNKGYKVVMITSEKLGDTWHDSKLGGTLKRSN